MGEADRILEDCEVAEEVPEPEPPCWEDMTGQEKTAAIAIEWDDVCETIEMVVGNALRRYQPQHSMDVGTHAGYRLLEPVLIGAERGLRTFQESVKEAEGNNDGNNGR